MQRGRADLHGEVLVPLLEPVCQVLPLARAPTFIATSHAEVRCASHEFDERRYLLLALAAEARLCWHISCRRYLVSSNPC